MKIRKIVGLLFITTVAMGFASCSSEDENLIPEKEIVTLTPEINTLKIAVGKSEEIKITKGNGDYKAFSLNTEVAEVKNENGKILVVGKGNGNTSILVSDQSYQYQKIAVTSYYDAITVDKELLEVAIPFGGSKTKTVNIISGNDGYQVKAEEETGIIEIVGLNKKRISILCKKEGESTLTITDALGYEKVVTVKVTATEIPYDEEELEVIKKDGSLRYVTNGQSVSSSWYTYYNEKVGELNHYGYKYYTYQSLDIYFAGEKSVGVKENSKISYKYSSTNIVDQPVKLEIIQTSATKIWAVYSFMKENKLFFGHFCQEINPPVKD